MYTLYLYFYERLWRNFQHTFIIICNTISLFQDSPPPASLAQPTSKVYTFHPFFVLKYLNNLYLHSYPLYPRFNCTHFYRRAHLSIDIILFVTKLLYRLSLLSKRMSNRQKPAHSRRYLPTSAGHKPPNQKRLSMYTSYL